MVLPLVLLIISLLLWMFSITLLFYKAEVNEIQALKSSNDIYWELENISTIAEYELFKGDKAIKLNEYKDIIEYFEDESLIWIKPNLISKSGYKRESLIQNKKLISGEVILIPMMMNILEIKLVKEIEIEAKKIEIVVDIYYEYLKPDGDFSKSNKREIRGVEAKIKYENIRD